MYRVAAVLLGGLALAAVAGCEMHDKDLYSPASPPSVETITARPSDYVGKDVVIEGLVRRVYGPSVFTIARYDEPMGAELLVLGETVWPVEPVESGDIVRIRGEVHAFDADVQAKYAPAYGMGGRKVAPGFYSRWKNNPALAAQHIDKLAFPSSRGG